MPAKQNIAEVSKAELRRRKRQSQRDKKKNGPPSTVAGNRRKKAPPAVQKVQRPGTTMMSMQTLRNALMANETQGMLLCRQMALPAEQMPVRLPTMNMARTAVGKFVYNHKVYATGNVGTTVATYDTACCQGFTADTETANLLFVIYGQLARSMISGPYYQEEGTYRMLFGKSAQQHFDSGWGYGTVGMTYNVNTLLPHVALNWTVGTPFLGLKRTPVGESNGKAYFFATAGCRIQTNELFRIPGPGLLNLWRHTDLNEFSITANYQFTAASNAAATTVFTIPENGHYAIELAYYSCESLDSYKGGRPYMAFDITKSNSDCNWGWHMHQMLDLNPTDFPAADTSIGERCRRTGCAVLISNVGNAYNKQGETVAGRIQDTRFADITPTLLGTTQEMYTGLAAKGAYTYMDFTEEDEAFEDVTRNVGSAASATTAYKLDRTSPVHVISFQGVYPRNAYFARVHFSVEWFSASQRYPMASPYLDPIHLAEARRINNSTSYFYENPIHIEDIMRFIRKGWALARSHAVPISRGIAAAFPEAAPVALPLGRLLQS